VRQGGGAGGEEKNGEEESGVGEEWKRSGRGVEEE
jgi:hypothetical protein